MKNWMFVWSRLSLMIYSCLGIGRIVVTRKLSRTMRRDLWLGLGVLLGLGQHGGVGTLLGHDAGFVFSDFLLPLQSLSLEDSVHQLLTYLL